ncbi:hypothetical protein [Rubrivivax benzoatilyticus]|uniref:Uncharacterized protein n=1 Tax=Rubrivivax benzoatilyticus TaxID=316997 RepID=A0ABX0I328_9BURK|nr:hypothetical protein [Rubrivivax benzoatilyticus]NHL00505.1 hypothetical protein [Rubrivivax benzoatilyticus]NHL26371.1 hypothetical protein [Rubrivivax benzoatilyticus]
MASPLEDLDELTLRCRDERARLYISEAVSSYRAGAFRSAIVATWIAVCFDVIEKLRELSLAGDKEAEKFVQDLDTTRRTGDVTRALKFERELLDIAKDKFELISPLEYIDLERLQADRNRCAHPSLTSDDKAYTPSAELARLHLHSAVTHLLQHPPAQGKYALDRLTQEIDSEYFPSTAKDARVAFASGPLRRPRESLVRNLVLVLTKSLLKDKPDYKRRMRLTAALTAVRELHPVPASATLAERLSHLFRAVPDKELLSATSFLQYVVDCWQYLEADVRQRLQNYVTDLPADDLDSLEFYLQYTPLQTQARHRVAVATKKELSQAMFWDMPSEVADKFISIYLESASFDDANAWAKQMFVHTGDFKPDHVRRIIAGAAKNSQVTGSFQFTSLLNTLRGKNKLPADEFERLLRENGLEEFALPA